MRVAVVGHIEWVDFIAVDRFPEPGDVVHGEAASSFGAGGAGSVVAGVLAESGAEVDFFTALGRDRHGEAAAAELAGRGVTMHVAWRDSPTRRAITLLGASGERTIVTVGERLQPQGADALEWSRLRSADGLYFTAGDTAALTQARQARVLTASPRGRAAFAAEGAGPPVRLDALIFSAHDRDEREWAERIATRARLLVATEGEQGGRWWGESSGRWNPEPLPGSPRDAYGCGDSFAAGFTFGLAAGRPPAEAAQLGAQWGARALTRAGVP